MHKHLCWIGRGTHIRGTQHNNKLQHGHTQQDMNGTVITCVHTCHLCDSDVFTLFVCGMQRIHKHKKVGCALTESLLPTPTAGGSHLWSVGVGHSSRCSHALLLPLGVPPASAGDAPLGGLCHPRRAAPMRTEGSGRPGPQRPGNSEDDIVGDGTAQREWGPGTRAKGCGRGTGAWEAGPPMHRRRHDSQRLEDGEPLVQGASSPPTCSFAGEPSQDTESAMRSPRMPMEVSSSATAIGANKAPPWGNAGRMCGVIVMVRSAAGDLEEWEWVVDGTGVGPGLLDLPCVFVGVRFWVISWRRSVAGIGGGVLVYRVPCSIGPGSPASASTRSWGMVCPAPGGGAHAPSHGKGVRGWCGMNPPGPSE